MQEENIIFLPALSKISLVYKVTIWKLYFALNVKDLDVSFLIFVFFLLF